MKKRALLFLLVFSMIATLLPAITAVATEPVIMDYDDYLTINDSVTVEAGDKIVAWDGTTNKLHAIGVGSTTIKVGGEDTPVSVNKAKLNFVLIAGQSNANGFHGKRNGVDAIVTDTGYGYYYDNGRMVDLKSKMTFGNESIGFYPALAYEWYELTGEKTYIVKHAYSGSNIGGYDNNSGWGDYNTYKAKKYTNDTVYYINEALKLVDTNKFEVVRKGYYWLQGESDAFTSTTGENAIYPTTKQYMTAYQAMHDKYIEALGEGSYGAIMACRTRVWGYGNIELCSMRVAHQELANTNDDIYMASVITEDWHAAGNVDFTSTSGVNIKGTTADMGANDIHYNQMGYNVLGLNAADNMYNALVAKPAINNIELIGHNGYTKFQPSNYINLEENLRITGNYNAYEAEFAQLLARPVPVSAKCDTVKMTLKDLSGNEVADAMPSPGYIDTTKVTEPLTLTVSAGNITKNYTVIPSADAIPTPPGPSYMWDFTGDTPVSVTDGCWTQNDLTSSDIGYSMDTEVVLKKTEPWTIEWKGNVSGNSIIMSKFPGVTNGNKFIYVANDCVPPTDPNTFALILVNGGAATYTPSQMAVLPNLSLETINDTNNIWYMIHDGKGNLTLALKTETELYSQTTNNAITGEIAFDTIKGCFADNLTFLNHSGTMDYMKIYRSALSLTEPNTSTIREQGETEDYFTVNLGLILSGSRVILACYKDNVLTYAETKDYTKDTLSFNVKSDYDSARVYVWDENNKPIGMYEDVKIINY